MKIKKIIILFVAFFGVMLFSNTIYAGFGVGLPYVIKERVKQLDQKVEAKMNQPPIISSLTANLATVVPGGMATITCTAYDSNGDFLTYTWTIGTGTIVGTGSQVIWSLPQTAGTYTITCEVSDGKAGISSSVAVFVANKLPVINSLTASPTTLAPGSMTTITCIATDPNNDPLTYTWTPDTGTITGIGSQSTWIAPQIPAGTYTITCEVSDGKGGTSTGTVSVTVTNQPPVIDSLTASPTTLAPGSTTTITCTAYDPNNDQLTYTWTTVIGTTTGTNSQFIWTTPQASAGTYTITCNVSDGKGGTVSGIASVIVTNQPPIIGSLTANPTTLAPGSMTTITCMATDPNGDFLTYAWTIGSGTINGTGSQVVWTLPLSSGTYTITCEVSDGKGGTVSGIASVTVTNQPPIIGSLTANPTTLALVARPPSPAQLLTQMVIS